MALMVLERGLMVAPHVRLSRPLKDGAMGSVWVADHLTLETEVAVKFVSRPSATEDPDLPERLRREASCAAKIGSPHVVQVFDQGMMEDGSPYIVMELLEGESLRERLERGGPLSLRQTTLIVAQVAKALYRAHRVRIVHRDIKPDNIFLLDVEQGGKHVKVLDFGVAKQMIRTPDSRKLTLPGSMIGTFEYMSREQLANAGEVDFRSDLWALGVVAYEMLTGHMPFFGDTFGQLCLAVRNADFVRPSEFRRELDLEVDRWFERAFDPEPERRFGSAKEMALAFVRLMPKRPEDIEDQLVGSAKFSNAPPPGAADASVERGAIAPNPLPDLLDEWTFDESLPGSKRPVEPHPPDTGSASREARTPGTSSSSLASATLPPSVSATRPRSALRLGIAAAAVGALGLTGYVLGLDGRGGERRTALVASSPAVRAVGAATASSSIEHAEADPGSTETAARPGQPAGGTEPSRAGEGMGRDRGASGPRPRPAGAGGPPADAGALAEPGPGPIESVPGRAPSSAGTATSAADPTWMPAASPSELGF